MIVGAEQQMDGRASDPRYALLQTLGNVVIEIAYQLIRIRDMRRSASSAPSPTTVTPAP